jgi:hypothetical protein
MHIALQELLDFIGAKEDDNGKIQSILSKHNDILLIWDRYIESHSDTGELWYHFQDMYCAEVHTSRLVWKLAPGSGVCRRNITTLFQRDTTSMPTACLSP